MFSTIARPAGTPGPRARWRPLRPRPAPWRGLDQDAAPQAPAPAPRARGHQRVCRLARPSPPAAPDPAGRSAPCAAPPLARGSRLHLADLRRGGSRGSCVACMHALARAMKRSSRSISARAASARSRRSASGRTATGPSSRRRPDSRETRRSAVEELQPRADVRGEERPHQPTPLWRAGPHAASITTAPAPAPPSAPRRSGWDGAVPARRWGRSSPRAARPAPRAPTIRR